MTKNPNDLFSSDYLKSITNPNRQIIGRIPFVRNIIKEGPVLSAQSGNFYLYPVDDYFHEEKRLSRMPPGDDFFKKIKKSPLMPPDDDFI
jgi:hypothetical protein